MAKAYLLWLVTAGLLLALCACSLPKCDCGRTNVPCNVGFYRAECWQDMGWKPENPPVKFRAKLVGSPG